MQVKIDTKERFHVITIEEPNLSANMTEELQLRLLTYLEFDMKNIVLNLKDINSIDDAAAETLINIQQNFYERNASFIICELKASVEESLDNTGLLQIMNVVPSQSEAGDIVQMEEIERELLSEDE